MGTILFVLGMGVGGRAGGRGSGLHTAECYTAVRVFSEGLQVLMCTCAHGGARAAAESVLSGSFHLALDFT